MSFAIDHPIWLLLLLLIPPSVWVGWRWMSGIPRGRRIIALFARALLVTLCALALSGVQRVEESDRIAVVALLDVSGSVRSFADFGVDDLGASVQAESAYRTFIERASSSKDPDDMLGIVAFDGVAHPIALPARSGSLDRMSVFPRSTGSDFNAAIARARAMLPPDTNARLLLLSDGRSTTDPSGIVSDVPIDVVPVRYEVQREVVVESIELPARALPESIVEARVVIRAADAARGELRLFYDGAPIDLNDELPGDALAIELRAGRQVQTIPVQLTAGRVHRFQALFQPESISDDLGQRRTPGDTSLANNSAGGITITPGHGRILVIDGVSNADATGAGAVLPSVLTRSGWDVQTLAADDFPSDLLEIEQYDLVVLVNTPRDALDESDEALIETYTRVLGGGLVLVGGPDALGAGGWKGADLAEILPVSLDVADDVIVPETAVVIVLDSSGSMRRSVFGSSRSQQTVANESAAGAIDVLDPSDQIGVISFSGSPRLVVPIGPNDDPEQTRNAVLSIRSDGGTNLPPAMDLAREQLMSVEAKSRHIIVLSDGQSQDAETLPGIAQSFGAQGIKVSTIAVGDNADESTLRKMAELSGGVGHRVLNPARLPRVFLKAIRVVRSPMIREEPFTPIIVDANTPATDGLSALPTLNGLVLTERLDDPLVSTPIVSDQGEPLLAYRQVELGRVGVFTSDASAWAQFWIGSPVFERFWTNLARWTMRADIDEPGEVSFIVSESSASIEYEAIDENGAPIDGLIINTQLYTPDGSVRELTLTQVGPGNYSGAIDGLAPGVHVLVARPMMDGQALLPSIAGLEVSEAAEYAHLNADPAALIELAARTGGRVLDLDNPGAQELFDRSGVRSNRAYTPWWRVLVAALLIAFLLDLAARRVAWDRWIAIAKADTLAVTRAVQSQTDRLRATKRTAAPISEPTVIAPKRATKKRPKSEAPSNDSGDQSPEPGGLLAAKRRARERIDEFADDDQSS